MSGVVPADAEAGTALPELPAQVVTRALLTEFAQVSGDRNVIHLDPDAARAAGLDDVIAHGMLSMGFLGRLLTEWVPVGDLLSFRVRFAAATPVGARLRCTASVKDVAEHGAERRVRLSLSVRVVDGPVTVRGEALVRATARLDR